MKKKNLVKKNIWGGTPVSGDPTASSVLVTENTDVYSLTYTYSGDEIESNKPPIADDITISGTLVVTNVLTANVNEFKSYNNKAAGTHTYQWYRANDKKQAGETSLGTASTHTLVSGDATKYIRVEVSLIEADGTNSEVMKSMYTNVIAA